LGQTKWARKKGYTGKAPSFGGKGTGPADSQDAECMRWKITERGGQGNEGDTVQEFTGLSESGQVYEPRASVMAYKRETAQNKRGIGQESDGQGSSRNRLSRWEGKSSHGDAGNLEGGRIRPMESCRIKPGGNRSGQQRLDE